MTGSEIHCPQCDGENELPTGVRFLTCSFCGSALYVERSGVVCRYRMPPLLDREQARSSLRRWMSGNSTVKDLDRKSEIGTIELLSFPMWVFRVDHDRDEVVHVMPAGPIPVPDMMDFELPPGRFEPYLPSQREVDEIEVSVPVDTALEWLGRRDSETPRETALVQVPFWRCRYTYRDRDYLALVDAVSGAVLASIYPEKAESPFVLVFGLGLVLFLIEGLAIAHPMAKALAFLVTAVPLFGLAYWVARKV